MRASARTAISTKKSRRRRMVSHRPRAAHANLGAAPSSLYGAPIRHPVSTQSIIESLD